MRLYIAGHTGLIGSALVRHFAHRADVEVVTATRAGVDLTDSQAVRTWLARARPDSIIISAGKVGGIWANATFPAQFIYDNLMIQANVIHAAWQMGITRVLNFGSSCMYPKHSPHPMRPEDLLTGPLEPTSAPYAIAKIAGVSLCESYNRQYGMRCVEMIPCTVYGPGDNFDPNGSHVLAALIRKFHHANMLGERSVTLWGSGQARRELLYVADVAQACELLLETYDGAHPINIGSGQSHTIQALATMVAQVVGFSGQIQWDTAQPDGAPEKLLDSSAMRELGWSPRTNLRTGIEQTFQWFLEHNASGRLEEQSCKR